MKLMVLDGNSILNRAYYGIRPLSTREGLYTHAVYGFITTLQRLLDEENPEALCVTFDRREPTFRHRADADYKAQRKPMPPELAMQLPVMKQVLAAMSVPCYELAGYEADDLIGTISRKCQAAGWDCVIVTGDKDSLQHGGLARPRWAKQSDQLARLDDQIDAAQNFNRGVTLRKAAPHIGEFDNRPACHSARFLIHNATPAPDQCSPPLMPDTAWQGS